MAITKAGKAIIVLGLLGAGYWGANKAGLLNRIYSKSQTIDKEAVDLPTAPANAVTAGLTFAGLPSTSETSKALPEINLDVMAWNSQMGLMFANGGAVTTEGSLMEKNGIKLSIKRQDDINQASQELIKFAQDYKNNPSTAKGTNAFVMMGDGSPATLASLNEQLVKLGDEYKAVVIGAVGRSNGEDALMAPPSWKENPQSAVGGVVATVIRDGDFNIVLKWAGDNGIKINPDEKTYDPTALNFVNAADFVKAGEAYISGYSEDRKIVKDGVATGQSKKIGVDAVSTWTPVDYNIATKKGGLVRIVSTHEYSSQMPGVIITISKYASDNRKTTENFLSAIMQGGDQVKSYSNALNKAGQISAKVYNEQDGDFWVKYDKGTIQSDKTGTPVELGGSSQFNLADNLNTFGIAPGSSNTFGIVFTTFSKLYKSLYPNLFKSFPAANDILDVSYLQSLASKSTVNTVASTQTYSAGAVTQTIASRAYNIEFNSGSADLTNAGKATVDEIANSLLVANALKAEIDGYTDNTGDSGQNVILSQARAQAVKAYIQSKSAQNFPEDRFTVNGYGSANPVGDNNTVDGRASNRRVVVKMGK